MEYSGAISFGVPPFFRTALVSAPKIIRDLRGLPAVLARSGPLELRLATTKKEIRKAQRLRYRVFYREGGAPADPKSVFLQRDRCPFDRVCDHLLVIDTAFSDRAGRIKNKVVGTYRLMRSDMAATAGFYSETEFAIQPLLSRHADKRFLELGRSCVHGDYRSKRAIDLLWHGVGIYAAHHGIDVLIGCSSLAGTSADSLSAPLSYAFHYAAADPLWQVEALPGRGMAMDRLAKEAIDPRQAMARLPPLMKAYVRAGGRFASEAVVDRSFGTTDLFTVLPLAEANARYMAHFGRAA